MNVCLRPWYTNYTEHKPTVKARLSNTKTPESCLPELNKIRELHAPAFRFNSVQFELLACLNSNSNHYNVATLEQQSLNKTCFETHMKGGIEHRPSSLWIVSNPKCAKMYKIICSFRLIRQTEICFPFSLLKDILHSCYCLLANVIMTLRLKFQNLHKGHQILQVYSRCTIVSVINLRPQCTKPVKTFQTSELLQQRTKQLPFNHERVEREGSRHYPRKLGPHSTSTPLKNNEI